MTPTHLLRPPTRAVRTAVMDSARWDDFVPRPDDIVIATFAKCGTTWTQRIVDLLVFQDPAPRPVMELSPWLDSRIHAPLDEMLAKLEAQTHRRFIKSHLPFDALPVWAGVKYIHVARDGRDAFMSWHNHQLGFTPQFLGRILANLASDPALAGGPPRARVSEDPQVFFQGWIAEAEADPQPGPGRAPAYFDHERTFWAERRRPEVLFVHYNDLKADLAGEMRRIADFLGIDVPDQTLSRLADAARFESMKRDGEALLPKISEAFDRGHDRFLNQGVNGRWKKALSPQDLARYEAAAAYKLSPGLAAWLEGGRRAAGDPRQASD